MGSVPDAAGIGCPRSAELAREFLIRKQARPRAVDLFLEWQKELRDEDPTVLPDPWSISLLPMVYDSYARRLRPGPAR